MAAKLASIADMDELLVSEQYFNKIKSPFAINSCGCKDNIETEEYESLWEPLDISNYGKFDFDKAYRLTSKWCRKHGAEFCQKILRADK